jgi:hypothetical protein
VNAFRGRYFYAKEEVRCVENISIVALIGVTGTICGIVFGYAGYSRGARKDSEQSGREVAELKTNTDYIRKRIDDVLLEQRDLNRTINVHAERLTRVEESAKQAHKRIDEHIAQEKG